MSIHDVDRHLYRVEMEAVLLSHHKDPEMHLRILMTREPDVANLARFTGAAIAASNAPPGANIQN
jgi:hypothetical protein